MSQALMIPPPALFMPQKQPAKPLTKRFKVVSDYEPAGDQPSASRHSERLRLRQVNIGVSRRVKQLAFVSRSS